MQKEVTLRNLNNSFIKELVKSRLFWFAFSIYLLGILIATLDLILGGIIMFVGALIMINTDYQSRQIVVKRLRWVK